MWTMNINNPALMVDFLCCIWKSKNIWSSHCIKLITYYNYKPISQQTVVTILHTANFIAQLDYKSDEMSIFNLIIPFAILLSEGHIFIGNFKVICVYGLHMMIKLGIPIKLISS